MKKYAILLLFILNTLFLYGNKVTKYECWGPALVISYNTDTIRLARLIYSEAEPNLRDKLAVGTVVLNRVKSKYYPNTIQAVISQKRQFNGYNNKRYWKSIDKQSFEAAKRVLEGYRSFGSRVLYFFNPYTATNRKFVNNKIPKVVIRHRLHWYST